MGLGTASFAILSSAVLAYGGCLGGGKEECNPGPGFPEYGNPFNGEPRKCTCPAPGVWIDVQSMDCPDTTGNGVGCGPGVSGAAIDGFNCSDSAWLVTSAPVCYGIGVCNAPFRTGTTVHATTSYDVTVTAPGFQAQTITIFEDNAPVPDPTATCCPFCQARRYVLVTLSRL